MSTPETPQRATPTPPADECLASVRDALAGLKYGNISLTIHEGRVVQIDVTEKKRLKPS